MNSLGFAKRQRLVDILCAEYMSETQMETSFKQHALRMQYPQFRARLLRLATEEKKHADWLRERILALGGSPPEAPLNEPLGGNSWECLLKELEEDKRSLNDLEDRLLGVETIDPEIAQGLRQIQQDERHHRDEIRDMLMRSDPHALWPE